MTWDSVITGRAHYVDNSTMTNNVVLHQAVSSENSVSCVAKLGRVNHNVDKGVNWGHSCDLSYNHDKYNDHSLCPNNLVCNRNVVSHVACLNNKINMFDPKNWYSMKI